MISSPMKAFATYLTAIMTPLETMEAMLAALPLSICSCIHCIISLFSALARLSTQTAMNGKWLRCVWHQMENEVSLCGMVLTRFTALATTCGTTK